MSISAPPTLSEDVLYAIAEQMLFTKPMKKKFYWNHEVDLRQENAFTNFMCLSPSTFKVFVAQFVKMKHIEFWWKDCVKMYKDAFLKILKGSPLWFCISRYYMTSVSTDFKPREG
uniref:Retrovirus-related Pol polyprotein from transposon 17.6 n=1 Tax=Globodera pallida TaxID=36090 RepID=A0A183BIF9_GLOPA